MSDYEKTITISDKDIESLPYLDVNSEGTLKLKFRVVSKTSRDDESMGDKGRVYYTLECEVMEISSEKPSLDKSAERALQGSTPIRVKNSINPAP